MSGTEKSKAKSSKTDKPVKDVVGEYPERPYADAISASHIEFLAAKHPHRLDEIAPKA
jgi:hypothetical protein